MPISVPLLLLVAMFSFGGWGNYARDDLAEYRAHYPTKSDQLQADRNVRFYRNEIACKPEGATIEEVHKEWFGDYRFLEGCHSYIQWLFPIQESGLNPQAQVLQKHEIQTMRGDPAIIQRIKASFALMLDFYGFELNGPNMSPPIDRNARNYVDRFDNLSYSSHNYLRITRMLKFLGEVGLEEYKIAWLRAFEREVYETEELTNCRTSFQDYWVGTIYDDAVRQEFINRYKARPKPAKSKSRYSRWGSSDDYADATDTKDTKTAPQATGPHSVTAASQPSEAVPRAASSGEPKREASPAQRTEGSVARTDSNDDEAAT
jgi:hypothetical protein